MFRVSLRTVKYSWVIPFNPEMSPMLSNSLVILVRLLHIVVGASWVGTMVFLAAYLLPTVKAVGPAAGPVFGHLTQVKKIHLHLLGMAILTVLSGITLFWHDSFGFKSDVWMHSGLGLTFSLGGTIAIVVMVIGVTVNYPAAEKLGELGAVVRASGPPSAAQAAEMERLQNRLAVATKVAAVLLVIAVGTMAVARYVPL